MWPLTNPVAKYFGDTSYTLYLWHWPVIQLLSSVLAKGPVFYVVASVLSLGLTAATYRYYENPIRHSNWLVGTRSRGGALSRMLELTPERWGLIGGVAALAILVSLVGISYNDSIEQANKDAHESAADSAKPNATVDLAPPVDPCFGAAAMVTPGCALWNPDQPVVPSIDQLQDDKQGAYECHRKKEEAAVKSCTYGYLGDDAKRIAVVGDSHAASLLPALWPSLEQNKWRVTTFTGWGCRFDMGDRHCPMKDVQAKLLAQPFDVVLMTGFRGTGDDRVALQEALAPITAAGSSIVFIADVPRGSAEAIACLTRANTGVGKIGDCGTPRSEALAVPDEMTAAASAVPGSTLVDLTKYFCNEDRCPSVIGNVVVFLDDGGHLTATFARTLAAPIADGLRQAMQPKKQDGAAPETGESSPAPGGAAPETGESSPAPNVTGTAPPP